MIRARWDGVFWFLASQAGASHSSPRELPFSGLRPSRIGGCRLSADGRRRVKTVGKAARAYEGKHFALFRRKLGHGLAKILEVEMAFLVAHDDEPPRIGAVAVLNLAGALAVVGIVDVAQDGEQPRPQARSGLEFIRLAPRPELCLLDEIVGEGRRSRPLSTVISETEGELLGTAAYISALGKILLITNEHNFAKLNSKLIAAQLPGNDGYFKLHRTTYGTAAPFDVGFTLIDPSVWRLPMLQPNFAAVIPQRELAPAHAPLENELLFFKGYSMEGEKFLFDTLPSTAPAIRLARRFRSQPNMEATVFISLWTIAPTWRSASIEAMAFRSQKASADHWFGTTTMSRQ